MSIDVLQIIKIPKTIVDLDTSTQGKEFLDDMRDIHIRHPEFFKTLLEECGYLNMETVGEFEQGKQYALNHIAAMLSFAMTTSQPGEEHD